MAYPHGMFTWADLASPDGAASADFYSKVMGWTFEEMPDAGGYGMFRRDGKLAAGMGPLSPEEQQGGRPPVWSSYINVDDIDAVAAKAAELGATPIMEPMDVMTAGRIAFYNDPGGAAIGLWQPRDHLGADVFNDPGYMSWNELYTRDIEAAKSFYTALLPWQIEAQDFGGFAYNMIVLDGNPNGGMLAMPDEMPAQVPAHWLVWFRVADVDETIKVVTASGGNVQREPSDTPAGRSAVVVDPNGAAFAIIQPAQ